MKTLEAGSRQSSPRRRWWHSFWLWMAVAVVVLVLALVSYTAAAQTQRATSLIEQALALRGNASSGAALYESLCASCHGAQAYGDGAAVMPSIAGQLPVYVIKQLVDVAEGDRVTPEMHRVVALKRLTGAQALSDLATYLRNLPPNPRPEVGDGKALADGKRYYDGLCAFCHGANGEGNEKHATPALQRQHYSYLLMQSRRLAVGHRYSVPVEVIQVLEKLPFDELTAIADHVSRLPDRRIEAAHAQPQDR